MTIDQLHDELFEVLLLVDDICKKERVKYFLDGGTEIGSVREKDFIPWDDDIDIKILREDYPAFKEAMLKHLPEHYRLVEPIDVAPAFYDFVTRVIDTTKPIREESDEDRFYGSIQNRIGVDVFILEKAPDGALAQKLMMFKCKMLYGMAMSKRYKVHNEKYSFTQKLVTGTLRIMGKPFSTEKLIKMFDRAMRKYENKNTNSIFPATFPLMFLKFFKAQWYRSSTDGLIRDHHFPIPEGYHDELTKMFGDYMQPPKDKSIYITHL